MRIQPIVEGHGEVAAVRKAVRLALLKESSAILLMFDADEDCPKDLMPKIENWAKTEAWNTPCLVVLPKYEYEAWFLAAMESLRGKRGLRADALPPGDPEAPQDAKGRLEDQMEPGRTYSETVDQAPLTAEFDLAAAHARSRSFRRMVRAFGLMVSSAGIPLKDWPPTTWRRI